MPPIEAQVTTAPPAAPDFTPSGPRSPNLPMPT